MGNCQAVDAAALVIQHPNGRIERMFCSIPASEVMKMNPGHYVSLIIPLHVPRHQEHQEQQERDRQEQQERDLNECNTKNDKNIDTVRVKLLRSTDALVLGRAYRLITSKEVMKVLKAKRHAKMKKMNRELQNSADEMEKQSSSGSEAEASSSDDIRQVRRDVRHRQRSGSTNLTRTRSKSWQPSLQSISEAGS